jgi:hypothetical protein
MSRQIIVKNFQRTGFNNDQGKNGDCAEDTGLNQGTCCLPLDVEKDTASADDIESDDTDLIVREEIGSTPAKVLEDIFKELVKQNQDSHCESSDSDDNSNVVGTNHSRPLPSHKEALQCASQSITYSSAHQPQFKGDLFRLYNSIEWQWMAAKTIKNQLKIFTK